MINFIRKRPATSRSQGRIVLCQFAPVRMRRGKWRAGRRDEVHYSKPLTEHDIKHIERHLSMKRTIRKKIMRDLQQAFVQDPTELSKNSVGRNKREINLQSLNNGPAAKAYGQSEPNILD